MQGLKLNFVVDFSLDVLLAQSLWIWPSLLAQAVNIFVIVRAVTRPSRLGNLCAQEGR
jgi:hypothetical protein